MIIQKSGIRRVLNLYDLCLQKINPETIKRHPSLFRSWVEASKQLRHEPLKTDITPKINWIKQQVITIDKNNKLKERLRKMQQRYDAQFFFHVLLMLVIVLITLAMLAITVLTQVASLVLFNPLTMNFLIGCFVTMEPLAVLIIVTLAVFLSSREKAIHQLKARIDKAIVLGTEETVVSTHSLSALTFLKQQPSDENTPTKLALSDSFKGIS